MRAPIVLVLVLVLVLETKSRSITITSRSTSTSTITKSTLQEAIDRREAARNVAALYSATV
jgi:hypothetical protein